MCAQHRQNKTEKNLLADTRTHTNTHCDRTKQREYSLVIHAEDIIQVILLRFIFNQQLHLQERTNIWCHLSSDCWTKGNIRPVAHTLPRSCGPLSITGGWATCDSLSECVQESYKPDGGSAAAEWFWGNASASRWYNTFLLFSWLNLSPTR